MPLLFVASFAARQQITKYKMRALLEERLLQEITINDNEIQWIEKNEEIRIDGKMFDIKNAIHHNGTSTFTCLFDGEETLLIWRLDQAQEQNSPAHNKLLTDFFQWLQSVYDGTDHPNDFFYINPLHRHVLTVSHLPNQFVAVVVPPPVPSSTLTSLMETWVALMAAVPYLKLSREI